MARSTWLINAFHWKTLCLCAVQPDRSHTTPPSPGFLIILPPFLLQVPLAHDIFGLISPNAGLGISIGNEPPGKPMGDISILLLVLVKIHSGIPMSQTPLQFWSG